MSEAILIAFITGGLAVISNLLIAFQSNSKTLYRIGQLEKKQDKHNQLIERMYAVEARVDEMKEDIEELKRK